MRFKRGHQLAVDAAATVFNIVGLFIEEIEHIKRYLQLGIEAVVIFLFGVWSNEWASITLFKEN